MATGARSDADGRRQLEALLAETLRALRWPGNLLRLQGLLAGYDAPSIEAVRYVLWALGLGTTARPISATLDAEDLPVLIADQSGQCRLVTADENGGMRVFDSVSGSWGEVDRLPRDAQVFSLISHLADEPKLDAGQSWTTRFFSVMERKLVSAIVLSLGTHVLSLAFSLLVLVIYSNVVETGSADTLVGITTAIVACAVAEHVLRMRRGEHLAFLTARFDGAVSAMAFQWLMRMPTEAIETVSARAQAARVRRLAMGRELFSVVGVLCDIPVIVISILLLLLLAGIVSLIPVVCGVMLIVFQSLATKRLATRMAGAGEARTTADEQLYEFVDKIEALRAVGAEHTWVTRSAQVLARSGARRLDAMHLNGWLQNMGQASTTLALVLTLSTSSLLAIRGVVDSAVLFTAMTVVWRMMGPVQQLAMVLPKLAGLFAGLRKVDELARAHARQNASGAPGRTQMIKGRMRASGVSVRFGAAGAIAIRSVDLAVKPGEFVVIAGIAGSGKSTLLRVLAGLVEAKAGTVTIDDIDIRQFEAFELSQVVGYVPLEPVFFAGTLADNMRRARPGASDSLILNHLAMVDLALPRPWLPDGLNTRLDDGGGLPLGLLQRIGLARELLKAPKVLLIDDSCCAIDLSGQVAILKTIAKLKPNLSIVMVSSTPEMMMLADRVVMMSAGLVADQGPPDQIVPKLLQPHGQQVAS